MTGRVAFARFAPAVAAVLLLALAGGASVLVALRLADRTTQDPRGPEATIERGDSSERPISAEADVWRNVPAAFATDERLNRRPRAHSRTLATWRMRRAFPGAPPRIPHGLTPREALSASCNTCHQRGGYSPRFGSHTPVTPHAELQPCTQCHVSDAAVTGLDLPGVAAKPDASCRQCHFPAGAPARSVAADLQTAAWSRIEEPSPRDAPPVIPHDLQLRGNCQACHTGPGAVDEIRVSHPERTNCRQCHVAVIEETYGRSTTSAGGLP